MLYISLGMILAGAAVIAYSLCKYIRTILFMKHQTYNAHAFRHPVYSISVIVILFFLVGYLVTAVLITRLEFRTSTLLIAAIFFFGAVFVYCMVRATRQMAATITEKTSEIVLAMINAVEAKDRYTKGHSVHVMQLSMLIYDHLPPGLKDTVDPLLLRDAALLHDIGKIGMPDNILNKPGSLTDGEMEEVRRHPGNGTAILEQTSYKRVAVWVLYHHERMDGQGYYSLPGDQIPLEARIMAVADTFSALYTDRIYRRRLSYPEAIGILKEAAGTQLDAMLVELFCGIPRQEVDAASVLE